MKRINLLDDDKSAEILINAGADITIKEKFGNTARDLAARMRKISVRN